MVMQPHKLQMLQSSQDCDWRTPPELVFALQRTFPIDLDLAATAESAVIQTGDQVFYLGPDHPNPELRDALSVPWHTIGKCGFLNPPYSLSLYSDGLKAEVPREKLAWLLIENWASKAYHESLRGFTTIGVFPYAPQTQWFREYVMGHGLKVAKANRRPNSPDWSGHAALDYWKLPHRVDFLRSTGEPANNANVNTAVVIWGPNPGFVGAWVPSGRYWTYRTDGEIEG